MRTMTEGRRLVAPNDAIWLQDSAANRMIIHGIYVTDRIGLEEARRIFLERVIDADGGRRYPRFRERVVRARGRWYWEDDPSFDIARHLVPCPLAGPLSARGAQDYIESIAHEPLPGDRPPWRIEYVEEFEDGGSAFIVRLHHAMADGIAFVPIILSLMDAIPAAARPPAPPARRGLVARIEEAILVPLAIPVVLLERALWRADRHALHGARVGGHKRVAWTRRFPLDEVKRFKDSFGATVNDVLMAMVAGAIGRYLDTAGKQVPFIQVSMPMNMRAPDAPLLMENRFAAVPLKLPSLPLDLPRRVAGVKARLDMLKHSRDPQAIYSAVNLLLTALPSFVSCRLLDFFANKCTSVVTNVPGPQTPLTLGGRRLRTLMFWVPQRAHIGLGISILTLGGGVQIGVIADTSVLKDPAVLVSAIEREFDELAGHLSGAGRSPAPPGPATTGG